MVDLTTLRVRVCDFKARAEESAVRGDVRKLIDDLAECQGVESSKESKLSCIFSWTRRAV